MAARSDEGTYRLALVRGPDLAPLVPLFREVYGRRDFTLDWLRGKYGGRVRGLQGFSCVAFTADGEAASAIGMLPWPIRMGARTELAAQVVDLATDARHRRRGLFLRVCEMAEQACADAGVSFLFAFPQPHGESYQGFVHRLGYAPIGDLVEYRRPVRTLWAERLARRAGGAVYRAYLREVERRLAPLAPRDPAPGNSLVAEGFAATDRDRAFLDYKAFAGSRVLAVDGGRVWLKVRFGLMVGDLEARSEADMDRTERALRRLAARLGVHQIIVQSSPGTRFSSFFAARYRTFPCVTLVYKNIRSEIPPERLRFTFGDLDNY